MRTNTKICLSAIVLSTFALLACGCGTSRNQVLAADESQVKLRNMQSRIFDTNDKIKTLRAVIATLQDLGFVVDKADDVLGSVSGTKLDHYAVRITVTARPHGQEQMLVRANAQYNLKAIEDPEPYQQFFTAFEKAMFLSAHDVAAAGAGAMPASFSPANPPTGESPQSPPPQAAPKVQTTPASVNKPNPTDDNLGCFSSKQEKCAKCGKTIAIYEKHFSIENKILCAQCYEALRPVAVAPTKAQ